MIFKQMLSKALKPCSVCNLKFLLHFPKSISFIAKGPFPTQTIFQPTNIVYLSVSSGCLQTTIVITPKTKNGSKEREVGGHRRRKKAVVRQIYTRDSRG